MSYNDPQQPDHEPTVPLGDVGAPQGQPGYQQPGWGPGYYGPGAPYGVHPATGIPYSERSKIVAGLLQLLVPLGIGRFYIGDNGMGIAQLLVTILSCGIGAIWPFIDGIVILVGTSKDSDGRILRS